MNKDPYRVLRTDDIRDMAFQIKICGLERPQSAKIFLQFTQDKCIASLPWGNVPLYTLQYKEPITEFSEGNFYHEFLSDCSIKANLKCFSANLKTNVMSREILSIDKQALQVCNMSQIEARGHSINRLVFSALKYQYCQPLIATIKDTLSPSDEAEKEILTQGVAEIVAQYSIEFDIN